MRGLDADALKDHAELQQIHTIAASAGASLSNFTAQAANAEGEAQSAGMDTHAIQQALSAAQQAASLAQQGTQATDKNSLENALEESRKHADGAQIGIENL